MVTIAERLQTFKDYIRQLPNGRWQLWHRPINKWVFDDSFESSPAGEGKYDDVILSYEDTKDEDAEVE